MSKLFLIVGFACLAACTSAGAVRRITAKHVDCMGKEIQITELHKGIGTNHWRASCAGKTYACTQIGSLESLKVTCVWVP